MATSPALPAPASSMTRVTSQPLPAGRRLPADAGPQGPPGQGGIGRARAGATPHGHAETQGQAARAPRAPVAAGDPDLLRLVAGFARLYLEVTAGRRERRHLAALVPPRVARQLLAARPAICPGRIPPVGQVRGLFGARTAASHFDAVVIVHRAGRCEALAVRLQRTAGRWHVAQAGRPQDQASAREGQ